MRTFNISRKAIFAISALAVSALIATPATALGITLEEAAVQVEETSAALAAAKDKQEQIAADIEGLSQEISSLEEQMPALQDKAASVMRAMYRDGNQELNIIEVVLGARSFTDAVRLYDVYNEILDYQTDQLDALVNAKNTLATDKASLEEELAAQENAVAEAQAALEEAQAARTQAQAEARAAKGGELASQIDWSMTQDEFVEHWGTRINDYLSGTPLSGQGEAFADAAYENGTDPRWSPAISRIESGCGAACFRPHNAWGWMGKSFSSWEEGIYAHVKYLAGPLYGGYLTQKGAATYCPPGGPWFSKVSNEMSKI